MLCKICELKVANKRHIEATHKIKYEDYLKEYEKEFYSEKQAIQKINELYITTRNKFIQMSSSGQWVTVEKTNNVLSNSFKRKYALCDKDVTDHLRHKKTIGVYMPSNYSKFITFDIDKLDIDMLESVVNSIAHYIPKENIHCSFSGLKGYHIEIFFKELVPKDIINKFYHVVLADTGYKENEVECRGNSNQAVKLPLGINFKNNDGMNNYCFYCNEYGVAVKDSLEYIQSIKPIDAKPIFEAVEINFAPNYLKSNDIIEIEDLKQSVKPLPGYNKTIDNKVNDIEKLIKQGISVQGSRHESLYEISIYLKDIKGFEIERTKIFLNKWLKEKCSNELFKSTKEEIEQDIKDTCNCIYKNDYKMQVNKRDVSLSNLDIKEILSIKSKALRHIYFILYVHCKAYGDITGLFYMTYEQMGQAGANGQDRRSLKKQLEKLQSEGKIQITESNVLSNNGYIKKPNKYRINALNIEFVIEIDDIKTFQICNLECSNCLEIACSYLLETKDIKDQFNKNSIVSIRKLKGECKNVKNR